jgi:hypothetical protein
VPPTPEDIAAGRTTVKLLLVPASPHIDTPIPPHELTINERARTEVMEYLDARRLLTYTIQLDKPDYRYVAVAVEVRARKRANKQEVQQAIQKGLYRLINPVNGGPEGEGWPWGAQPLPV